MKQLEFKHISPYLPYNVTACHNPSLPKIVKTGSVTLNTTSVGVDFLLNSHVGFKLLLRPMSDLFNDIKHGGKTVNVAKLIVELDHDLYLEKDEIGNPCIFDDDQGCFLRFNIREDRKHDNFVNGLRYWIVDLLFEYHFDVFNLIEQNLAEPIK